MKRNYRVQLMVKCILIAVVLAMISAVPAFSATCGNASIKLVGKDTSLAGTTSDGLLVNLQNDTGAAIGTWGPGQEKAFLMSKNLGDQGYATLLTARSLTKPVWIVYTDSGSNTVPSLITTIMLY